MRAVPKASARTVYFDTESSPSPASTNAEQSIGVQIVHPAVDDGSLNEATGKVYQKIFRDSKHMGRTISRERKKCRPSCEEALFD